MKRHLLMTAGVALAAMLAIPLFTPSARAGEFDQYTKMTFHQPVEIPGRVLAPGTYWFKLLSPDDSQNVVVIYSGDFTRVEALLLTDPAYRMNTTDRTQLQLAEQARTTPDALLEWFYPGMKYGHDFVYSARMQNQLNEDPKLSIIGQPPVVG